jgi:hypothetical protein
VRCPEHPDALLQKVQGQRFMGVWFPDFICPVDGKRFTYLEYLMAAKKIDRKEARKLMVREAERYGVGVDPLSTLYADMVKELVIKEVREFAEKKVKEVLKESLLKLLKKEDAYQIKEIIREALKEGAEVSDKKNQEAESPPPQ